MPFHQQHSLQLCGIREAKTCINLSRKGGWNEKTQPAIRYERKAWKSFRWCRKKFEWINFLNFMLNKYFFRVFRIQMSLIARNDQGFKLPLNSLTISRWAFSAFQPQNGISRLALNVQIYALTFFSANGFSCRHFCEAHSIKIFKLNVIFKWSPSHTSQ